MDAATFQERRDQQTKPLKVAAADLEQLSKWQALDPVHRSTIQNAASCLRIGARLIETLGNTLFVYSGPAFYADLAPSLAKEDQGKHAASTIDTIFSE